MATLKDLSKRTSKTGVLFIWQSSHQQQQTHYKFLSLRKENERRQKEEIRIHAIGRTLIELGCSMGRTCTRSPALLRSQEFSLFSRFYALKWCQVHIHLNEHQIWVSRHLSCNPKHIKPIYNVMTRAYTVPSWGGHARHWSSEEE